MIFGGWPHLDHDYHRWFAWRPVILYGPDEWRRERLLGARARFVWFRMVWRWRCRPRTYYALFDEARDVSPAT